MKHRVTQRVPQWAQSRRLPEQSGYGTGLVQKEVYWGKGAREASKNPEKGRGRERGTEKDRKREERREEDKLEGGRGGGEGRRGREGGKEGEREGGKWCCRIFVEHG